ncbi:IclR family transcriptional regulator [Protaetiibacter intestinalis]|uniref:IclR family transcriptional regulator n=1 Tax=Protaetiibacter intestinalis TaxID=2419774 RepID=A0A387BAK3_9MICO|nr:IclR family transcriptional regulator [Protaetiibacter intestinalis]AYF98165.1 IclR family transcriptional regulator [Protaetiibacter intestinalis]
MTRETPGESRSGAQAVERVLAVLEVIAESAPGLEIAQIADAVGVSASTAYRLVGVLQRQGYVVRHEHRYVLGRTVGLLGVALQQQMLATPAVQRALEAARDETHAPVYLTGFFDEEVVVAHIADSPEHPRIGQLHVGFSEANHATAFGKLMLASKAPHDLDEFLERTERRALTPRSITSTPKLRDELARVRREQLAVEVEEYLPLLACIAAPVRSRRGSTIGAVSISVSADDFRSRADELGRVVRRTAWHVASELEGDPVASRAIS